MVGGVFDAEADDAGVGYQHLTAKNLNSIGDGVASYRRSSEPRVQMDWP
jgi:hypothetical protein